MSPQNLWAEQAQANASFRARSRLISRAKCKHIKKRSVLESDTAKWLKHYLPAAYPLPFGQVHLDIIAGAENALKSGGKFVVAAPRGTGKSSVLWGVALKMSLTGKVQFPALLPWKASDLKKALRFWKSALCFNEKLTADYPEYCQPFAESRGSSQKCMTLIWSDNEHPCGAELRVSDGMIVFPDGRGAIGSSTINGNPRGLNHATEDGRVLRPDLVFIDDPQDKDVARSPTQTASITDVIDTDVMGMAGPDQRMPMLMSCTVIQRGDVATHYLESRDWSAVRVGQIVTWPTDMKAWDVIGEMIGDKREHDAIAHYKANRESLTAGMTVSWSARFDKKRKEPDAFYSAMRDYFFMGAAAFMAERQNEPIESIASQYTLTIDHVSKHTNSMKRLEIPTQSTVLVAHIDINRTGLHFCVAAFDQSMTGHCPIYGRWPQGGELWPKNAPELVRKQAIFRGLKGLCDSISKTQFTRIGGSVTRLGLVLVDRGYEPDVVHKFCASQFYPFRLLPSRGYAAHKYFPRKSTMVGRPFEGCHITQSTFGHFLAFNADMWRETAQRAFLADVGAPGGFTLHSVEIAKQHERFAEHVCAEKLTNKYETPDGLRWEWRHVPGSEWDWGDALTGCWVAAAANGLSASGMPMIRRKYTEARRPKVMVDND